VWAAVARAAGCSYVEVRDEFAADELEAWLAYLDASERMRAVREKAQMRR
jgi:hypothetical protein